MLSALSLFIQDGGLAEGFLEPGFGLRSASGEVERRRRGVSCETKPKRNAAAEPQTEARRSCGRVPMPLVTSARFEQRNRRGREGDGAGRKPVQRSKPCVGHGATGSLRGTPALGRRNENPRLFSNNSTRV